MLAPLPGAAYFAETGHNLAGRFGAFWAAILCGYLGQNVGWWAGFGLAGIGMLVGLILFTHGKPKQTDFAAWGEADPGLARAIAVSLSCRCAICAGLISTAVTLAGPGASSASTLSRGRRRPGVTAR